MKYLILLIVGMLLLVSCTTQVTKDQINENETIDQKAETVDVSNSETKKNENLDADILIVDGKVSPNELSLELNKETTLTVHNLMNDEIRLDIPMYKSEVSENIKPNKYEIIKLFPRNKGFVSIELNGVGVGTITIK